MPSPDRDAKFEKAKRRWSIRRKGINDLMRKNKLKSMFNEALKDNGRVRLQRLTKKDIELACNQIANTETSVVGQHSNGHQNRNENVNRNRVGASNTYEFRNRDNRDFSLHNIGRAPVTSTFPARFSIGQLDNECIFVMPSHSIMKISIAVPKARLHLMIYLNIQMC